MRTKMDKPQTTEDPVTCLLLYDGLNDAFIGSVETFGRPPVACYSKRMTLNILEENYNLTAKQARERYEYEYLQNNYGEATPTFLDDESPPYVSGEGASD